MGNIIFHAEVIAGQDGKPFTLDDLAVMVEADPIARDAYYEAKAQRFLAQLSMDGTESTGED